MPVLAEIARACARETESNRRISDDLIEGMRDAELFRILQPEAYAGLSTVSMFSPSWSPRSAGAVDRPPGSMAWAPCIGGSPHAFPEKHRTNSGPSPVP